MMKSIGRHSRVQQAVFAAALLVMALLLCRPEAAVAQTQVTTPGGTANKVPKFTASATVGDSTITELVSGNVGIGIANPTAQLHILKELRIDGTDVGGGYRAIGFGGNTINVNPTIYSNGSYLVFNAKQGSPLYLNFDNGAGNTLINPNGGNVGIGTTTPSSRFHVYESPLNAAVDKAGSYFFLESSNNTGATINNTHTVLSVEGSTNSGYGWAGQIGVKSVVGPNWGPITDARAFYAKGRTQLNFHNITNYQGYYVDTPTAVTNTSITNAYGLYVALQKTTNVSNGYGVYQAGAADINYFSGHVGIGTIPSPSINLHVAGTATVTGATSTGALTVSGPITSGPITSGTIIVSGDISATGTIFAKYQDVAEWVPARVAMAIGTVVVVDPGESNQVMPSAQAYDTRVAGVISQRPGVILGEGGDGKVMVATSGRVRVKVDATSGAIKIGDLLVTSDREGVAMRSRPLDLGGTPIHRPGTLIGKALEPLEKGVGEILVLLSLQ